MFQKRFEDEKAQLTGREAMARTIRRYSERNTNEWKQETEEVLEKS